MNIALFCIGGSKTGNGHVYRTKLLYNSFKKKKIITKLYTLIDFKSQKKNIKNLHKVIQSIIKKKYSYIFFDCSSLSILKEYTGIESILNKYLRNVKSRIIQLDALKNESVKINPNLIYKKIIPYLNNTKKKLSGRDFVLIDSKYSKIKKNIFKKKLKIVVTFGSTDYTMTNKILNFFLKFHEELKKKIEVKIVVGQYCSNNIKTKLKKQISLLDQNNIKFVINKKDLVNIFKWSNVIFTNDGLTKYEALLSGRYTFVLRSKTNNNIHSNQLKKLKLAKFIDLKIDKNDSLIIESEIKKILDNKKLLNIGDLTRKYFSKNNILNYYKLIT